MDFGLLLTPGGKSSSHEWSTPKELFDRLHTEFDFTLDPCSTHENALLAKHYTCHDDGLAQDWRHDRVFMNPPYGRSIGLWMKKAYEESKKGALVVCLLPARTDTAWWHNYAMKGEIRFLRRRLKFGGHKAYAPFPSVIVVFRNPWP